MYVGAILALGLLFIDISSFHGLKQLFYYNFLYFPCIMSAYSSSPLIDIKAQLNQALSLHKSGNIIDAITSYETLLFPNEASEKVLSSSTLSSLHGNLGALLIQVGDYDRALRSFDLAVKYSPESSQVHYNIAVLYTANMQQHKKALTHAVKALRLDPTNHKISHLLGNIFQGLGRIDEAEKYFIKAEELASLSSAESQKPVLEKNMNDLLPILQLGIGEKLSVTINSEIYDVECVSKTPHVYIINNLLSASECDHIINQAKSTLQNSFVMGGSSLKAEGFTENIPYRTSYNAWLPIDPVLSNIRDRIASVTGLPLSYIQQKAEQLQVVKYETGGEFKVHQDSSAFHPRLATILMYLSSAAPDPSSCIKDGHELAVGGATWFPYARNSRGECLDIAPTVTDAITRAYNLTSESSALGSELPGISVQPRKGNAVLFFNYAFPDFSDLDVSAVHAGLPVLSGEKWVANYWIDNDVSLLRDTLKERS